jgi:hypothetical protein
MRSIDLFIHNPTTAAANPHYANNQTKGALADIFKKLADQFSTIRNPRVQLVQSMYA